MFGFVIIEYLGPGYEPGSIHSDCMCQGSGSESKVEVLPSYSGFLHHLRPQNASIRA